MIFFLNKKDCSEPCYGHTTLAETKDEREARGHPIGNDVPYQAMGGITGFSSLAEGYLRLDPSGRGNYIIEYLFICLIFLSYIQLIFL